MADDPTSTTSDNQDAPKRKRRVLRAAPDTSTLREKSEKAQAQSSKPRRSSGVWRVVGAPFRAIGRLFRPLGRFRFFRVLGLILFPPYFRNSVKELRQVSWPDRRQTRRLVFAVIVFSLAFGSIVAAVDYGLDKAFRILILDK
jgi:preprotein translocase SecE subunit